MNAPRAIPTLYKGTQFRSRHEATWAAAFDLLGWRWDYEPCDLAGYIPDFDLHFARYPLLVEIKPTTESLDEAKAKIARSGWDGPAAILIDAGAKTVGAMFDGECWDAAVIAACLKCNKPTLIQEAGRWFCRNCGAGNRDLWFAFDTSRLWAAAKNTTQWRPT